MSILSGFSLLVTNEYTRWKVAFLAQFNFFFIYYFQYEDKVPQFDQDIIIFRIFIWFINDFSRFKFNFWSVICRWCRSTASSRFIGSSIRGAGRDHCLYIGLLFSSLQLISLRITIHNTSTWTNRPGIILLFLKSICSLLSSIFEVFLEENII